MTTSEASPYLRTWQISRDDKWQSAVHVRPRQPSPGSRRRGGHTCRSRSSRCASARVDDARVYTCTRYPTACGWTGGGWVTYESAGHTATELARYGCLFNMCNRQRAQIQSIKSINDSIVRSRRDTCASSWVIADDATVLCPEEHLLQWRRLLRFPFSFKYIYVRVIN